MPPDPRGLLWDARLAAAAVARFIAGRALADYLADEVLRSAVERRCEVAGEALSRLRRIFPDLAARVAGLREAVDFRNLLIHGYATIDDAVVWRVVTEHMPRLAQSIDALLADLDRAP